jgi:hypothetical protein
VVPPTRGLLAGGIVVASPLTDDRETAMSTELDLEERSDV